MEKKNNKASLAEVRPDLVHEWDYERNGDLRPEQFSASSNRKVWWICSNCGQSWMDSIANRVHGRGCPYDMCRRPVKGKEDLATVFPDVAAEWDFEKNGNLCPEQFFAGSRYKVWWKCSRCGESWQETIARRTVGGGCPNDSCQGKE